MEKSSQKIWDISVIFIKRTKANNDPMGENSPNLFTLVVCASWKLERSTGANVMITNFGDFGRQMAFILETNVMIQFWHKTFRVRMLISRMFRRKYFANHNIGPWSPSGTVHKKLRRKKDYSLFRWRRGAVVNCLKL
jgi:hypothetical protein